MIIVANYHVREGEQGNFISLELMGDIEMVQSQNTGRFYATSRRCFVSSTFDEITAKRMVGKEMPGNIVRKQCEPYEYTMPETGEVIMLAHTWDYQPEGVANIPDTSKELAVA
ncbi:MAG: hypothetical protein H6551_12035 [Chitinophagales bacterium]|nr:hypothetical protein [Chitinophagaceae bacterium]MCB9065858.1 hypothetical protein [Chitinophagales bacterium]